MENVCRPNGRCRCLSVCQILALKHCLKDSVRPMCAVAELSKTLASFFCVCSRDSPEFEPSHGAHRQATLVVEGGFGHTGRSTFTCSVWADSTRYRSP